MYTFFCLFFFLLECSHFTVTRVLFPHPIKTRGEKMLELKKIYICIGIYIYILSKANEKK